MTATLAKGDSLFDHLSQSLDRSLSLLPSRWRAWSDGEKHATVVLVAAAVAAAALGVGATYVLYSGGRRKTVGAGTATSSGSRSGSRAPAGPPSATAALLAAAGLDEYERAMAKNLVDPDVLTEDFAAIGGLGPILDKIRASVLLPLARPDLFAHSGVAQQPTGLLLYGPPGTGKTMIARAIARTAKARFLCINAADIQSKWFGETPRLVQSIFSLARKCSPCIIFIDEVGLKKGDCSSRSRACGGGPGFPRCRLQ